MSNPNHKVNIERNSGTIDFRDKEVDHEVDVPDAV